MIEGTQPGTAEDLLDHLTIVVVTHNSKPDLKHSLPGLYEAADHYGLTIVMVDNASQDSTRQMLSGEADESRIRYVQMGRNAGYATAVNAGFAAAGTDNVLLLNPDVELFDASVIARLCERMAKTPYAGIVAPRLVGLDGAKQPSARRDASLAAMLGSNEMTSGMMGFSDVYERYLKPTNGSNAVTDVDWVIGAAMLIRRDAYDSIGGWDSGFFLYMEDADFCRRLRLNGWTVTIDPSIEIRHAYRRSSSAHDASVLSSRLRRAHYRSLARYWRKHPALLLRR